LYNSYCLSISTGTGRTLIFENENLHVWGYNVRWNELFEPITNCSYKKHVSVKVKKFNRKIQFSPW